MGTVVYIMANEMSSYTMMVRHWKGRHLNKK
jgi:hypothetical protein